MVRIPKFTFVCVCVPFRRENEMKPQNKLLSSKRQLTEWYSSRISKFFTLPLQCNEKEKKSCDFKNLHYFYGQIRKTFQMMSLHRRCASSVIAAQEREHSKLSSNPSRVCSLLHKQSWKRYESKSISSLQLCIKYKSRWGSLAMVGYQLRKTIKKNNTSYVTLMKHI